MGRKENTGRHRQQGDRRLQRLDQLVVKGGFGFAGEPANGHHDQLRDQAARKEGHQKDDQREDAPANRLAEEARAHDGFNLRPEVLKGLNETEFL